MCRTLIVCLMLLGLSACASLAPRAEPVGLVFDWGPACAAFPPIIVQPGDVLSERTAEAIARQAFQWQHHCSTEAGAGD